MKFLPDLNQRQVKGTDKQFQAIKAIKDKVSKMSYEEIQARVKEMKEEIKPLVDKIPFEAKNSLRKVDRTKGLPKYEMDVQNKLNEFLPEVYAFMDEVFFRKLGFRYHDVQLKAGIILAEGQRLVELYTGEGKTMTFQLPLVLYSIAGRGAHLVTVNDYLSRRDGEYAGHIASALGLSVGIVTSSANYKFIPDDQLSLYKGEEGVKVRQAMKSIEVSQMDAANLIECNKRDSYNCDITYGTNNEFGFDYLRDNMAWDLTNIAQRELYFCVIDEADSILIDEARTPLIISGVPSDANTERYVTFAAAVKDLKEGVDYEIDHKMRSVNLTEDGIKNVEGKLGVENIWKDYSLAYHIENALKAQTMFNNDEHYLVKGGEVLIVDEFTGRILKGRRYSEGLHQAIEAKEGVDVRQESKTYATITFQNFFRLYKILCGGSGTVMTEAEEFYKIYGLETVAVPTNKPVIRIDSGDKIYKTQEGKFKAVVNEIKELNAKGQPVLVGTTSVEKSEVVSRMLDAMKIPHEVLNAKYHEQEAKIIERAGRKGAVTVATNMAGRGADIVIGGGSRGDEAYKEIAALGGLHVIGTERHEARRIDNQLRGRTGRQGEPGSSRFFVALDDQLMRILGGEMMGKLMNTVGLDDDMPIEMKIISRQIESAQKRIEGMNFDSRKRIVEYDDVMNQHREIFYTRRRNLLQFAEEAAGRIAVGEKVIDASSDKDLKDKFTPRMEVSREKLKTILEKILSDEVRNLSDEFQTENPRWNEKTIETLVKKFYALVPEHTIAKILSIQASKVTEQLVTELKARKFDTSYDYLVDFVKKSLELKMEEFGNDFYYLAKAITLQTMDNIWVDHLELMKDVREGIGLQAYAQKDPLVEYKNEAFVVFESFIKNINAQVAKQLLGIQKAQQVNIAPAPEIKTENLVTNKAEIEDVLTEDREFIAADDIVVDPSQKVGNMMRQIERQRGRQEASVASNIEVGARKPSTTISKQFGRNDKVSVKYKDGKILKDVKFKKVEDDILNGDCVIVE